MLQELKWWTTTIKRKEQNASLHHENASLSCNIEWHTTGQWTKVNLIKDEFDQIYAKTTLLERLRLAAGLCDGRRRLKNAAVAKWNIQVSSCNQIFTIFPPKRNPPSSQSATPITTAAAPPSAASKSSKFAKVCF